MAVSSRFRTMVGHGLRVVLAVSLLLCAGVGRGAGNGEGAVRLTVHLSDGSRVAGAPGRAALPCATSFAAMKIPLGLIDEIHFSGDNENARIDFANGDNLSVVLEVGELNLAPLFGEVSIPLRHATSLTVQKGGLNRRGLVLYYSFGETERNRVEDDSGNDNSGVPHGVVWTPEGKAGGAYAFDGAGDYIELPDRAKQTGPCTVAMWFAMLPTGDNATLYGGGGLDSPVDRNGVALTWAQRSRALYFDLYDAPKRYATAFSADQIDVADGDWHHVAAVYDGRHMALYVDGELSNQGKKEIGDVTVDWSRADHVLGKRAEQSGQSWYWKGRIDEMAIYERPLSEAEVKQLFRRRGVR